MQPLGDACALLPFDREPPPSSLPAKSATAVTHGGGEERTPSQRVGHTLATGGSMAARSRSLWKVVFIATVFASSLLLPSGAARAEPASSTSRTAAMLSIERFADFIAEASRRFDVPAHWIRAVMHAESAADVRALSPKGAMGLMQIMPATYATLRARYALGANPYDPRDNILAGAAYLREMFDRYGAPGFLAAYNAGPRRFEEHLRTGRPLPIETQQYVAMLAPIIGGEQIDNRGVVVADVGVPAALRMMADRRPSCFRPARGTAAPAAKRRRRQRSYCRFVRRR